MSQPVPSYTNSRQRNVQASAWYVVMAFFAVFCALVATMGYFGWRFYTNATIPVDTSLVLKYVATGVLEWPPGRSVPQEMTKPAVVPQSCPPGNQNYCDFFSEGQRLVGQRGAGYGQVAALKLPDNSLINLHTQPNGFDITLKKYQVSRWTNEKQDVIFEQKAGYARYDLAENQPYRHVSFKVNVQGVVINFAPGGSYSVAVPRTENGEPRGRLVTDAPILVEVAVRSGSATIASGGVIATPRPGEKVQVALDGSFVKQGSDIYPDAAWELVPDGDFSHFTTEQYNTLGKTTTWNIRSWASEPGIDPGAFSIVFTCPPETPFNCNNDKIHYGQFLRTANDQKPFYTGIDNPVDIDISEYTGSLKLRAEVSIIAKPSVDGTGERGTECPIFINITYKLKSPTDGDQFFQICVFTADNDNYVKDPNIYYQRVIAGPYFPVQLDLRSIDAPIKDAWYIQNIRIEARGHDYYSRISRVSLVGTVKQP